MRKLDLSILALTVVMLAVWGFLASGNGFRAGNAMIVARTVSVASTIDGEIENDPPAVGSLVASGELLVRTHNGRIDRSRQVEFSSLVEYLEDRIESLAAYQAKLISLLSEFDRRAMTYAAWVQKDTQLKNVVEMRQLDDARLRSQLKSVELERATHLFDNKHTSAANLQVAESEAEIAENQVELSQAQTMRSQILLASIQSDGVFFDDGDTSYWEKMVDILKVKEVDNLNELSELEAQLRRAEAQAEAESRRIDSSFVEEHRAPFSGLVNAGFVSKGTRVASGTALLQLLDCTDPIVIVPLPEHRIGEFSVGMKVTIYPIDSEQELSGRIRYVSSGPLIGQDTTIQVQQTLTLDGNRAVVTIDGQESLTNTPYSCETARKAIVVIHTRSLLAGIYRRVSSWSAGFSAERNASL